MQIKTLILTLVFSLSLSCTARANYGEENITNELANYRDQLVVSFLRESVVEQRDSFDREQYSLEHLMKSLPDGKAKEKVKERAVRSGSNALATGHWRNDTYYLQLGEHRIHFSINDVVLERIYIDGEVFELRPNESFDVLAVRLENFIENNIVPKNQTSWFESTLDLFFPKALAENNPYSDILFINSIGVIHLKVQAWVWWRDDVDRFKELLAEVTDKLRETQRTCRELSSRVRVNTDSVATVYEMLHPTTAETLEKLAAGEDGNIRQVDVLRGAMTEFATSDEHGGSAPEDLRCEEYFESFIARINVDVRMKITEVCDQTKEVESCLNQVRSKHKTVADNYRGGNLKLYDGVRVHQHDGESSFRDIEPGGSRDR